MALDALLLARDPGLLVVMRRGLEELGIRPEICSSAPAASELLARRKFEAIIVDCDGIEGGREVLRSLRTVPSNRNSIVFAVVHKVTSLRDAFEMGANFVLDKPVAPDRAVRSLRAAHPLMVRERRRSFRQPIDTSVMLQVGPGPELRARSADLSEGGLCIAAGSKMQQGHVLRFRFMLPDTDIWLEGKAQVAWSNEMGRTGLQFVALRNDLRIELCQWLAVRLDQEPQVAIARMEPQASPRGRGDLAWGFTGA